MVREFPRCGAVESPCVPWCDALVVVADVLPGFVAVAFGEFNGGLDGVVCGGLFVGVAGVIDLCCRFGCVHGWFGGGAAFWFCCFV